MTPSQLLTLEANMQILAAEDELREGVQDDNRLYDLALLATGNEERASELLAARLLWRQRQATLPDSGG